ncbi:MAG TPA: amidase, partial [Candidatus Angelobacter sp.]
MQQQQGKFILFDLDAFASWLDALKVSRVIQLVQNHHTFIPSYNDFNGSNHFDRLKAMEDSHLERGFDQIAQNLTTFPDGTLAA